MRPKSLENFVGQEHLVGPDKPLRLAIEKGEVPSMVFWGPPGSGKTTLANIISNSVNASFEHLSAVLSGVKDVRLVITKAKRLIRLENKKTILFIDEIHRFNKAQQDAFLPYIEQGIITLIGATTENPSFEVIRPLLSRVRIYILYPLTPEEIEIIIRDAIKRDKIINEYKPIIKEKTIRFLANISGGDARVALDTLEIGVKNAGKGKEVTENLIVDILQKRVPFDKKGEEHYNLISAFIKSIRGSDPDAALYYLVRMIEGGEDPLFIVRRLIILASEDIGNADPQALLVAVATKEALNFVGLPEGFLPLSQATIYLATAPKSNSAYIAYKNALKTFKEFPDLAIPLHLRNAPTELMEKLGYGKGYKYPHNFPFGIVEQQYLPEKIKNRKFYFPKEIGYERTIKKYLEYIKKVLNKDKEKG